MTRLPATDFESFKTAPDDARVRINTVTALYGVCANTVWRKAKTGAIPAPRKCGGTTYWRVGDLRAALAGDPK